MASCTAVRLRSRSHASIASRATAVAGFRSNAASCRRASYTSSGRGRWKFFTCPDFMADFMAHNYARLVGPTGTTSRGPPRDANRRSCRAGIMRWPCLGPGQRPCRRAKRPGIEGSDWRPHTDATESSEEDPARGRARAGHLRGGHRRSADRRDHRTRRVRRRLHRHGAHELRPARRPAHGHGRRAGGHHAHRAHARLRPRLHPAPARHGRAGHPGAAHQRRAGRARSGPGRALRAARRPRHGRREPGLRLREDLDQGPHGAVQSRDHPGRHDRGPARGRADRRHRLHRGDRHRRGGPLGHVARAGRGRHRRSSEAGRGHRPGRRGRAQGRRGAAGPAHEPPDACRAPRPSSGRSGWGTPTARRRRRCGC